MACLLYFTVVFLLFFGALCDTDKHDDLVRCKHVHMINKKNIHTLKKCEYIEGRIYITNDTFVDMEIESLDILNSVRQVKGHVLIEAYHPSFKNLDFLKNLKVIESKTGKSNDHCITIEKTSLTSIKLPALERIDGNIVIKGNKELCYSTTVNHWLDSNVTLSSGYAVKAIMEGNNENSSECPCYDQCTTSDGCRGPSANECINCKNQKIKSKISNSTEIICVQDCVIDSGICNQWCKSCEGPCFQLCRQRECPLETYINEQEKYFIAIITILISVIAILIMIIILVLIIYKMYNDIRSINSTLSVKGVQGTIPSDNVNDLTESTELISD